MRLLRFSRPEHDPDQWFEAYYARALDWATHLTRGDRGQAEDLVHDAFVQLMAARQDLPAIENPEGYLYTALRYLHLANARRAARRRDVVRSFADVDLLDHDSLADALDALRARGASHVHESFALQLREVWTYAQRRKRTSKARDLALRRPLRGRPRALTFGRAASGTPGHAGTTRLD